MHPTWRTLNFTGTATTSECVVRVCARGSKVEAAAAGHGWEEDREIGESHRSITGRAGSAAQPGQLWARPHGMNCKELSPFFLFTSLGFLDSQKRDDSSAFTAL